jgi:hypothetical protein
MLQFRSYPLGSILEYYASSIFGEHDTTLLLDETGYIDKVDIDLPAETGSLEKLQMALQPYGLDIIKVKRERSFLVIAEN